MSVPSTLQITSPSQFVSSSDNDARLESQPSASATRASELARAKASLKTQLRLFPGFPIPGIQFLDMMRLFSDPNSHKTLIRALEIQALSINNGVPPDVIVGLDARGFLFGPSLALRLGAGFVPVRKSGKLPGPTVEASYEKEYGIDRFQMQRDAIAAGQSVLVVDDVIATGGSALAAGTLVGELGGQLIGYLFLSEIDGLKGRDKLNAPIVTLFDSGV